MMSNKMFGFREQMKESENIKWLVKVTNEILCLGRISVPHIALIKPIQKNKYS